MRTWDPPWPRRGGEHYPGLSSPPSPWVWAMDTTWGARWQLPGEAPCIPSGGQLSWVGKDPRGGLSQDWGEGFSAKGGCRSAARGQEAQGCVWQLESGVGGAGVGGLGNPQTCPAEPCPELPFAPP